MVFLIILFLDFFQSFSFLVLICFAGLSSLLSLSPQDPVTRRSVWDMIEKSKRGRVILLTTHSMEEADTLGDRICIMSKGSIQALGTSIRLKQKFGTGYRLTIFHNVLLVPQEEGVAGINQVVQSILPSCMGRVVAPGLLEFDVPRGERAKMPRLFRAVSWKCFFWTLFFFFLDSFSFVDVSSPRFVVFFLFSPLSLTLTRDVLD